VSLGLFTRLGARGALYEQTGEGVRHQMGNGRQRFKKFKKKRIHTFSEIGEVRGPKRGEELSKKWRKILH